MGTGKGQNSRGNERTECQIEKIPKSMKPKSEITEIEKLQIKVTTYLFNPINTRKINI